MKQELLGMQNHYGEITSVLHKHMLSVVLLNYECGIFSIFFVNCIYNNHSLELD